jgi:hypothetical protein
MCMKKNKRRRKRPFSLLESSICPHSSGSTELASCILLRFLASGLNSRRLKKKMTASLIFLSPLTVFDSHSSLLT